MKKLFFIVTFLYGVVIPAQRIILCKAYTNHGEPIDLIYSSTLTLNQSVCVLFSGEKKKISGKTINLFIDRIIGGGRENQLNKIFKPEKENWIPLFYKFVKEGKFEIYFTDEYKNRLSALTVYIGTPKETKQLEPLFVQKYSGVEVILSDKIQSGRPVNTKRSISLSADGGTIYICLNNTQPFGTEKILINTWRKPNNNLDYDEFVDSKKFQIENEWNDTYFRYRFTRPGEYKIYLYDEKELLIKTAYISVTN
ncbi:MAG: hypothetical protein NTX65_11015 [Ignavibacteriales bacterium]|nr:hypothetical protein [Ignavibacteriales bacterium]